MGPGKREGLKKGEDQETGEDHKLAPKLMEDVVWIGLTPRGWARKDPVPLLKTCLLVPTCTYLIDTCIHNLCDKRDRKDKDKVLVS